MRRSLLLLVLLLAVFSGSALAQEFPQTYCGDLSEADCSILTGSASAMRDLTRRRSISTPVRHRKMW